MASLDAGAGSPGGDACVLCTSCTKMKFRSDGCSHWLTKKNRWCNLTAGRDSAFCKEHDPQQSSRRVPCPVDPTHTIPADSVERHVKICNKTRADAEVRSHDWFAEDVNGGGAGDAGADGGAARPVEELFRALLALDADDYGDDEAARGAAEEADGPAGVMETHADRDAAQGGLILDKLDFFCPGLETADVAFVDLGAGKGGLGAVVRSRLPAAAVVLVERSAFKFKKDRVIGASGSFERVPGDLRDVSLEKVASLRGRAVVGVAKHLCGCATDLALKALIQHGGLCAVAIATCCHHACNWRDYVGRDHFAAQLRCASAAQAAAEFKLVSKWSSWATGGARAAALKTEHAAAAADFSDAASLAPRDRLRVGRAAKRILDAGRLDYLTNSGLCADRQKYCAPAYSPENNVILASSDAH
ncbi:methyltransferase TRM13-domain-containing protein [Pelagophyceae sp. CCMP2097]|nr:methyltransferase TRM13-domain-containing protein [Pelagophyceae sp. CCMP2097]